MVFMVRQMLLTHRMCALMIGLANAANSLGHALLAYTPMDGRVYLAILCMLASLCVLLLAVVCVIVRRTIPVTSEQEGYVLTSQHDHQMGQCLLALFLPVLIFGHCGIAAS